MTAIPVTNARRLSAVLHVPHASLEIPTDARPAITLSDDEFQREIRRMTDSYTDELFVLAPTVASVVAFPISRQLVDPERFVCVRRRIRRRTSGSSPK